MGRGTLRTGCRNGGRESFDFAGASVPRVMVMLDISSLQAFEDSWTRAVEGGSFFPQVVRMSFHSALAENTNARTINGVNRLLGALSQNMTRDEVMPSIKTVFGNAVFPL